MEEVRTHFELHRDHRITRSRQLESFISNCLRRNPEDRPSLAELINDIDHERTAYKQRQYPLFKALEMTISEKFNIGKTFSPDTALSRESISRGRGFKRLGRECCRRVRILLTEGEADESMRNQT